VWEPASRLVLTWDIDADLQYDPALQTEIEVRIIAEQDGSTRVKLKHRRLDRFGNRRDEMRTIYDKTGDWGQLLVAFAQAAETSAKAAATSDVGMPYYTAIVTVLAVMFYFFLATRVATARSKFGVKLPATTGISACPGSSSNRPHACCF
jgi:hypothetical protein